MYIFSSSDALMAARGSQNGISDVWGDFRALLPRVFRAWLISSCIIRVNVSLPSGKSVVCSIANFCAIWAFSQGKERVVFNSNCTRIMFRVATKTGSVYERLSCRIDTLLAIVLVRFAFTKGRWGRFELSIAERLIVLLISLL